MFDLIAFDADDTLWHSEDQYVGTQDRFKQLLAPYHSAEWIDRKLFATEMRNLRLFGYGIKGVMLSMIETAIEVTQGKIPAEDIDAILRFGRVMIEHPVELIDGAREVIDTLRARDHEVWLITKGDLFDQESKIARSGLTELFHRIEIVSEKDEGTYRRLLERHGVEPEEFAMVGNSIRSDILPVTAIGAAAFHVPYHVTWALEVVSGEVSAEFVTLSSLRELPSALTW